MYSEPLVKASESNKLVSISMGEPVNYEQEISHIKEMFSDLSCQLSMKVEIATLQNLEKMIYIQPTILHFICHGDFD